MPTKEIFTSSKRTTSQVYFISWLNSLIQDYNGGIWDKAVGNLLSVSFINKTKFLMVEMFDQSGEGEPLAYMVILPTDSRKSLLMVMRGTDVLYYNDDELENFISFNTDGDITNFQENLTLSLKNPATNKKVADLFISMQRCFGIDTPKLFLQKDSEIEFVGVLDIDFINRKSGSYMVEIEPIDSISKIAVTNITEVKMKLSIPIVPNLSMDFDIEGKETVLVPNTALSEYFVRNSAELGSIEYKIV